MSKKLKPSKEFAPIFNRIIEICDSNKNSVSDLLDKFASSRSAMITWKKGNIPAETAYNIAKELNVSIDFLVSGKEKSPSVSVDEQELLTYYRELPKNEQQRLIGRAEALAEKYSEPQKPEEPEIQLIPKYYIPNKVSAGFGQHLDEYEQGKTVYVPDSPENRKADFILTVSGDSMEPKFRNGDNILVRSQDTVQLGQIGIFDVDGEGYIKKLGDKELISLNPEYPNIPLENRYVRCFGLVLGTTDIIKN